MALWDSAWKGPVTFLFPVMPSIKVKTTSGEVIERQVLTQQLGEGQLRFWISTHCPGDDAAAGPPTEESKTLPRAGGRMLNNRIKLVQGGKVYGKTRKPQAPATYYVSITYLSPCFSSVPGLCVYLAGMKCYHQQHKTKTHSSPKSICPLSRNTPPRGTFLGFCKAVKAGVLCKQTPMEKDKYTNGRWWGKAHWVREHLLTGKNLYNNSYLPFGFRPRYSVQEVLVWFLHL